MTGRLLVAHTKLYLAQIVRIQGFLLSTLVMPTIVFMFYGIPVGRHTGHHLGIAAAFALLGIFTTVFSTFGVGLAGEREMPWTRSVRTLPCDSWILLAGRLFASLLISLCSVLLVFVVAKITLGFTIGFVTILRILMALFRGAIPLALLGIAFGYWVHPKSAISVSNVVFLALVFTGRFWQPVEPQGMSLTHPMDYSPVFRWSQLVQEAASNQPWTYSNEIILIFYCLLFGILALWGYKRDEGTSYA